MFADFYDLELFTAPGRVFTPRPATERLVAAALAELGGRRTRVADVGTGAGAIAVAIAVHAPAAEIWATDTNPDAVALARQNAVRHGVDRRVHVLAGDLLEPVPGELDLIVANLPYLPDSLHTLHRYDEEPASAVYAPVNGLAYYRRLLAAAEERLARGGSVLIQFHREVLRAERAHLPALRARLEESAAAAA